MTEEQPLSGLVVVDKPAGLTSHDVVGRVRRLAGTRKVGHAGTLDPMATGVLVLGVNRATRLLGHLMLTEKGYDATIRLGVATSTDDAEGETTGVVSTVGVGEPAVLAALAEFVGDIEQVPTSVSAIKIDGKRAYQRVRDGEEVTIAARPVTVHELAVHRVRRVPAADGADGADGAPEGIEVDVFVRCSSGTYIRAIARDLGTALGVGGHLTALRRTAVGPFALGRARTLEQLGERFSLLPIADAARAAFPVLELDEAGAADVRVGRPLSVELAGLTAAFAPGGEFLALYEPREGVARPVAVFV